MKALLLSSREVIYNFIPELLGCIADAFGVSISHGKY
jgi:hypothetical protein